MFGGSWIGEDVDDFFGAGEWRCEKLVGKRAVCGEGAEDVVLEEGY
jgi:hypothetical protein